MSRISLIVAFCWLALSQSVTAFVPVKGQSARSSPMSPPTVPRSGTTTALPAAAKKKGTTTAEGKKKGTITAEEKASGKSPAKKAASSPKKEVETVRKSDLIHQMSQASGLTKTDSEAALNAFMKVVQENVAEGKKVTLVGFGSFTLKERAARKGRNPQTGEPIDIPASKSPGFSAGKSWKERLNQENLPTDQP